MEILHHDRLRDHDVPARLTFFLLLTVLSLSQRGGSNMRPVAVLAAQGGSKLALAVTSKNRS
jgi:hypothetical protein